MTASILNAMTASDGSDAEGREKRARRLTPAQQLQIGHEILLARQAGISWKALGVAYDLTRTRLYMLAKAAQAACTGQDSQEKCS